MAGVGTMTIQELPDVVGMDHPTISRGVAPPVRSGLFEAVADMSGACKRVLCLTMFGAEKLNAAAQAWSGAQSAVQREADRTIDLPQSGKI